MADDFYHVLIRRNSDGMERLRRIDWAWARNSERGDIYWWTQGNFSCDCNREWEFLRAGGEEIGEDRECGGTAYTVIKAILPDGTEIIIDDPKP